LIYKFYLYYYFHIFTAAAKFKSDTHSFTFYSGLNNEIVVTIPFYSNPKAEISNIKWTNLSDTSIINQIENTSFDLIDYPFNLSVHTVKVLFPVQIAIMKIASFQSYHQGNYSITVSNGLPSAPYDQFWIIPSGLYII